MADKLPDQLLELIVRFTQSLSDVTLQISSPRTTTTLSLKQIIRTHLPPAYNNRRLRLIYAGKVLSDKDALFASLNLAAHRNQRGEEKVDRKGKQPLRDGSGGAGGPPPLKLYIHCSIGDALSTKELTDEASAAEAAEEALKAPSSGTRPNSSSDARHSQEGGAAANRSTSTAPRGFDRLLTTGFNATEVAALRSQFLNVLSHTHTPDTMPTGAELQRLEDRWLDSDANTANNTAAGGADGENAETWGADDGRALDDFLWGNVIGFFWPLGALVWGFREDGVWTRRRQIAVFTGLLINVVFGFARLTS